MKIYWLTGKLNPQSSSLLSLVNDCSEDNEAALDVQ